MVHHGCRLAQPVEIWRSDWDRKWRENEEMLKEIFPLFLSISSFSFVITLRWKTQVLQKSQHTYFEEIILNQNRSRETLTTAVSLALGDTYGQDTFLWAPFFMFKFQIVLLLEISVVWAGKISIGLVRDRNSTPDFQMWPLSINSQISLKNTFFPPYNPTYRRSVTVQKCRQSENLKLGSTNQPTNQRTNRPGMPASKNELHFPK